MNAFCKRLSMGLVVVFVASIFGCSSRLETMRQRLGMLSDPQLDAAIRRNITAIGGTDVWSGAVRIDGKAIATIYEADGSKSMIEQQHQIVSDETVAVSVVSDESGGKLWEQLDHDGVVKVFRAGAEETGVEDDKVELFGAKIKLFLQGQAMTGAASLLREGLDLHYAKLERQGGRLSHKVEITGRLLRRDDATGPVVDDLLVMWFNGESYLLEQLWLRYQKPHQPDEFGYMAAYVGDYETTPEGLTLPRRIDFVPSDQYQQFSQRYIITVEFQQLHATQEPPGK